MRVFDVEPGPDEPGSHHPWEHEIFVLTGEGPSATRRGRKPPSGKGTPSFFPPARNTA